MPRDKRAGGYSNSKDSTNKRKNEMEGEANTSKFYADQGRFESSGSSEADYWEALLKSGLGGLPLVGGFFQGLDRMQQLTDLYRSTGKVPAYATISGVGAGQLTNSVSNAVLSANRIANGFNDLYQFYTGEPDSFRSLMNGMYG